MFPFSSTFRILVVGIGLLGLSSGSGGWASPQFPGAGTTADPKPTLRPGIKKLFVRGMTEMALEDYEEATANFKTALDLAPEEPALLQALADAYGARGEHTTALFYARQARKHGPRQPYYHRRLAELQREAGHPKAAIRTYRGLIDRFPGNTEAYRALAQLQSDLDRPQAALETYNALLKRYSQPPAKVYREMLRLYRRVGNSQGIRTTLEALVKLRPNNRHYRRRLGQFYAATGNYEAAVNQLEPLLTATPNDPALRQQLRQLYRKTGRPNAAFALASPKDARSTGGSSVEQIVDRAESLYEDGTGSPAPDTSLLNTAENLLKGVLQHSPQHVKALTLLARIHEHKGNYSQAGRVLQRVLEHNPRAPDRWARAAEDYMKAHQYEKAAALAEEGFLLFPGHYRLARTAAFARLRAHTPDKALTHFQKAIELLTNDTTSTAEIALLKAGQGLAYTHLHRPQKADKAFTKAISKAPNHPMVLTRYAYSLALRKDQLDRALEMAQRAVEQAPENPTVLGTLGWVYFRKGKLRPARSHLQKALGPGGTSPRILEQYGDVQHALGNEATARKYWQKALDRAPNRQTLRKKLGLDPDI